MALGIRTRGRAIPQQRGQDPVQYPPLFLEKFFHATIRQPQKDLQILGGERRSFAGPLDLHVVPSIGSDHIHVDLGHAVLFISQIEECAPFDHTDRSGGNRPFQWGGVDRAVAPHVIQGEGKGNESPGDRRRTGSSIGLDHVTIDPDRPFPDCGEMGDGTQGPADETLNLVRAA